MPATEAKGKLLQAVSVKATKRSPADSLNLLYASAVFQESDQTLAMDQKRTYFDMWQYLQAMVPGIAVNKTDTGTSVNFGRYNGLDLFSSNESTGVQFFLNEVPVSADIIDALNPSDVALVKVYKGATAIALGAGRGAVSIYTSVGKSGRDWRDKGFDFFKKAGYSTAREFYSPAYGDTNNLSAGNDLRTTLYWNPAVKVINSRIQISFYNDDHCKKYRVMINGIDANGKLLQLEKLFE
jgi:hypothetical protein